MTRKMLNKKGVSPLIATVLLIAFAVALGAVVMNWGKGYVNQMTQTADQTTSTQLSCTNNVFLEFSELNSHLCFNSTYGNLTFIVDNTGSVDIVGLIVKVYGPAPTDINTTELTGVGLGVGGTKGYVTAFPTTYTSLSMVEIIPKIYVEKTQKNEICSKAALKVKNIPVC